MIVVLTPDANTKAVAAALQGLGLWARQLGNDAPVVFQIDEASTSVADNALLAIPGVSAVRRPTSPHPKLDAMPRQFAVPLLAGGTLTLGGDDLVLVAGPCAVESEVQIAAAADMALAAGARLLRGGAFKPRTSPYSFSGQGVEALRWLRDAAVARGMGVVTEAMSEAHVEEVAAHCDLIQIGSRNMQNFALLAAAGRTGKPVLLKRARGGSVDEWLQAGEHLLAHGAAWVMFCERGVAGLAGQTRNTLDLGAVALLRHVYGLPIAVDPSHAAGRRDLIVPLAKAAVAAGAHTVLVELHPNPAAARSDGPQALTAAHLPALREAIDLPSLLKPQAERPARTSRLPEFYKKTVQERRVQLHEQFGLSLETQRYLQYGGLPIALADRMTENVIGTFALPLSLGLNFRVNGKDFLVPMVVEEPSVVAAASNAARMVRATGGFRGDATTSVMTAQVQFDRVADVDAAAELIRSRREDVIRLANAAIPRMVARGGGCKDVDVRVLDNDEGLLVLHLYVDVGDAMGANTVDTVAEQVAPTIRDWIGGNIGLRILSNLPLRRIVHVECDVGAEMLGGDALADGVARASHFAALDPFRASTHNKGILNGIDAVALALGQDWRAIEAGAHAYAGLGREYRPLCTWHRTATGLHGSLELPMAIGTVGGSVSAHPGVRAAMELVQVDGARQLAVLMAAVGMASNLAALRALAGEGIQHGHMRLHARKTEQSTVETNGHETRKSA